MYRGTIEQAGNGSVAVPISIVLHYVVSTRVECTDGVVGGVPLLYYSVGNAKRFRQNNGVLKCGTPKCVPNAYQILEMRRTFHQVKCVTSGVSTQLGCGFRLQCVACSRQQVTLTSCTLILEMRRTF
jgi:hypothetical protein